MKISDIKQQVKRADRYSIYVDGKYSFSLGAEELLNSGIFIGKELDREGLDALQATSEQDKAYDRVLRYLAIRQRSEWELRAYLDRKKVSPTLANTILNKLSKYGYVDDKKFATAWLENRRSLKAISKRKLKLELRAKHISNEIIENVLRGDETDELEVLKELVAKKRKQARYQDDLKLMQYLARQGYDYESIKTAVKSS